MEKSYSRSPGDATPYTVEDTWFQDDGIWVISCSFAIWTMVSGFGLLESGRVSSKDEVNIMVKNIVDVVFGGLSYWMFGFGFTFGKWYPNPFIGLGYFFYDPDRDGQPSDQAWHYARFFLQMSFATTTSTIVSAAMAERIRLKPYIVITFLMTIVHSICAHWVWSEDGFLRKLGCVDVAGCSVIHLVGGVAGLASTLYLKPRQARFSERGNAHMSNPTNALLGTFMLWWGWLAFNTSTTMGVARGQWRLAARSAMVTLLSSLGGGCTSIVISLISTRKCQIDLLIDGLLASLVSMTAGCHSTRPLDSIAIGSIGSALALAIYPLIERLEIDDPVGVIPVHVVGATWGMISVGIFSQEDPIMYSQGMGVTYGRNGLLYSGDFELLLIQALGVVCIFVFSLVITFLSLAIMNQFPWGLRMTKYEEQLGADLIEHGLAGHNIAKYSIEKKLNVKNAYSVIKFIAKWKRRARLARERRLAEEAAARGEDPNAVVEADVPTQTGQPRRLGPLRLGGGLTRRGSALAPGAGTLTARPHSGRRTIENEKNSLPPMNSARRVHPLIHANTSLDFDQALPNGMPPNGSLPNQGPITIITEQPNSARLQAANNHNARGDPDNNSEESHPPNSGRRGILSRLKGRSSKVAPHIEELQMQDRTNATHTARDQNTRRANNDGASFDRVQDGRPAGDDAAVQPSSSNNSSHRQHNVNDSIV